MRRESDEALDTVLETHRAWIEGRAALETLNCDAIVRARAMFDSACDKKYGPKNYPTGPASEFNKIKKWVDK